MPTLPVLELLEQDLEKPVIPSASAMMWQALRLAGVGQSIPGYGRLLTLSCSGT
jgi:maleate isomerase